MKRAFALLLPLLAVAACDYETVESFTLTPPATPQSVDIEPAGMLVVSDSLAGRILRVDPDTGATSILATLPLGQCAPAPFPPLLGALTVTDDGSIYVNANTCDPSDRGVWKITPSGDASLHVPLAPDVLANGITVADGSIFIVDTFSDRLWSAPLDGGAASVFVTSPHFLPSGAVIDPTPEIPGSQVPLPGGNGVQQYDADSLVLANSSTGALVRVPLDGSTPSVLHTVKDVGCDDIAVDSKGNILCTTDYYQTMLVVKPGEGQKVVFDADDGLDGPTDVTCKGRRCYLTNAAYPFFPGTGNGPSVGTFRWPHKAR